MIDFRRGQNARSFVGFGWGRRQPTHTWMVDALANVRLRLPAPPTGDQWLVLEIATGDPEPARRLSVEVNGSEVAELACAGDSRQFTSHRLRVRRSVLAGSLDVAIGFRLREPAGESGAAAPAACLALQTLELRPGS